MVVEGLTTPLTPAGAVRWLCGAADPPLTRRRRLKTVVPQRGYAVGCRAARFRCPQPSPRVVMATPRTGDSGGTVVLPTVAVMTTTTPPATTPSRARTTRRALLGGGIGTLALVAGGSAWAADRYLIDHVEIDSASAYEASQGTASAATASTGGTVSGTTYTSDLATIDISTTVVGSGTDQVTYFVADVVLTDATALRSAFANDEFGLQHHRGAERHRRRRSTRSSRSTATTTASATPASSSATAPSTGPREPARGSPSTATAPCGSTTRPPPTPTSW